MLLYTKLTVFCKYFTSVKKGFIFVYRFEQYELIMFGRRLLIGKPVNAIKQIQVVSIDIQTFWY